MPSRHLSIATPPGPSCEATTSRLRSLVADTGVRDGVLTAAGLHATMAHMEPRLITDLVVWLARPACSSL